MLPGRNAAAQLLPLPRRTARAAGLPASALAPATGLLAVFFCAAAGSQGMFVSFFCAAAVWVAAQMARLRPAEE